MKHNLFVTIFLVVFFILAQVVGLALISADANIVKETVNGQTVTKVVHSDTSMGARPNTTGAESFIYIIIGIAVGTLLVLVLARFKQHNIWRIWFLIAVWIALSISLGVFIKTSIIFSYDVAMVLAAIFAVWKIFKPNIFIHNITEVLMYSGIALLLVPIFDLTWALVLLLAISVYDMYAVWKSKHMVQMAKFQANSKLFAGLMINYNNKNGKVDTNPSSKSSSKSSTQGKYNIKNVSAKTLKGAKDNKTAILGGGDIAFPLIFEGVIMERLLTEGLSKGAAFMQSSIIILTTAIALALLFIFAKKDKFYPAMPFVTAGCLIGWVIVLLI